MKEQETLGQPPWSTIPAPLKSCVLPIPFSPSTLWLIQLLNTQSLPTSQTQKEFHSLAPSWHKNVCCGKSMERVRRREGGKDQRREDPKYQPKQRTPSLQKEGHAQDMPLNPTRRTWRGCKHQTPGEIQTFILRYVRLFTLGFFFSSLGDLCCAQRFVLRLRL